MASVVDRGLGYAITLGFLLVYFPGGTIVMALSCSSYRLDGWDWVLSVIVPGFGLMKALFSSAC